MPNKPDAEAIQDALDAVGRDDALRKVALAEAVKLANKKGRWNIGATVECADAFLRFLRGAAQTNDLRSKEA